MLLGWELLGGCGVVIVAVSVVVGGCVVSVVVGVIGGVLSGSWVAIGRPMVRFKLAS